MYSKELINEVKELYPNSSEMIKHAEMGSVWLGRYLDDSSSGNVPIDTVLSATSLEKLQKEVSVMKRKVDLYIKWGKEYANIKKKMK